MSEFQMRPEEPPPRKEPKRDTELEKVLAFARQLPWVWCAVAEFNHSGNATAKSSGWKRRTKGKPFEFRTAMYATETNRVHRVYCRYVPKQPPEAA
jgi:hypothetical protein